MGEIFVREAARKPLDFDGERLTGSVAGQIEVEHLHRYFLARSYCRGKDVLDVASGEGYGAAYLAQVARSVVGVEIDPVTVVHAVESYKRPNLRYISGDARAIPLADQSVDVVVSFETIEHFYEQEIFIAEVRRVLRPGGLFIVSTPERDIYSPHFAPPNIYHCRELTGGEFGRLLSASFPWVAQMLQRPMIGSAILPGREAPAHQASIVFERRGDSRFEASEGMARPLYLIGFASDTPMPLPQGSLYIESSLLDLQGQQLNEARAALVTTQADLASTQAALTTTQADLASTQAALTTTQAEVRSSEVTRVAAERAAAEARATIRTLYASTTWRLMGPVRRVGRRLPGLARLSRRFSDRLLRRFMSPAPMIGAPTPAPAAHMGGEALKPEAQRQLAEAQKQALGVGGAQRAGQKVTIGIVTYNTPASDLRRLVSSARLGLARAGVAVGHVMLIDNGTATDQELVAELGLQKLDSCGNIGFGAGHNVLMKQAFEVGADIYIAANPDGAFHPDAITALIDMMVAYRGEALIEAIQFPEEHPKIYDIYNFDTPWISGACMAVPREIYDVIGGFDEKFFMYCEDVDYSWRARANGFAVKICPIALFFHAVTNRAPDEAVRRRYLEAGITLASKWQGSAFEAGLRQELAKMSSSSPPAHPQPVPQEWLSVANFGHLFSFAETRW